MIYEHKDFAYTDEYLSRPKYEFSSGVCLAMAIGGLVVAVMVAYGFFKWWGV
jgi:hypothetical protein